MRLKVGPDWDLEDQANEILMADRRAGSAKFSDKNHWLTDDQLKERSLREIYTWLGYPVPSIRAGLFRRAYNPLAHQRPVGLKRDE